MGRALALTGLLVGAFGLVLQFTLSLQMSAGVGRSLPASIEFFFAFFTVLTNTAAVLVYAAALRGGPAWFLRPAVRAGVAVAIAVVAITYVTVLAQLWSPTGWLFVADTTLHYGAPALFLIWWVGFARAGTSRLADIPRWLIYPLAYLGFVLARGALIGHYPYPFLDLTTRSAGAVTASALIMLALFVVVSLAAVGIDRWLPTPGKERG